MGVYAPIFYDKKLINTFIIRLGAE